MLEARGYRAEVDEMSEYEVKALAEELRFLPASSGNLVGEAFKRMHRVCRHGVPKHIGCQQCVNELANGHFRIKWKGYRRHDGHYQLIARRGNYSAAHIIRVEYLRDRQYIQRAKDELRYMAENQIIKNL